MGWRDWFRRVRRVSDGGQQDSEPLLLPAPKMDDEKPTDPDRPIESPTQDRFRRAPLAQIIASYTTNAPKNASVVFALTGPWGAGKTSVLNLVEAQLDPTNVAVVRFNPWLFSGTEQLTTQFIRELATQLGQKGGNLKSVGEKIEAYGALLEVGAALPLVGAIAKLVQGAGKVAAAHGEESILAARARVEEALRTSDRRVLVFVDDIDRLDAEEIRHVFKLVRLVADFPNVSYLLSFDRGRVESALTTGGTSGRDYIAKIVQSSFDLPPVDRKLQRDELTRDLDRVLEGRAHGPFHADAWLDILLEVILPLVETPRDIRRYVNAVAPTVDLMREEVALEDLLALEAIRVFIPDAYEGLVELADHVTMHPLSDRRSGDAAASATKAFIKEHDQPAVLEALLRHVFPRSQSTLDNMHYGPEWTREWRRHRRVATRSVFEALYHRGIQPNAVPASLVREVVESFGNAEAVNTMVGDLDSAQFETLTERLLDWAEDLAATDYAAGLTAILGCADRLRHGSSGFFDFGADLHARRLVLWVARHALPKTREPSARRLVESVRSFTWRIEVLRVLATDYDSQPRMLEVGVEAELTAGLRDEILASPPTRLAEEWHPGRVISFAMYDEATSSYLPEAAQALLNARLMRAVLSAVLGQSHSFGLGSAAARVKHSLPLRTLLNMCGGDEDALRERLRGAIDTGPADSEDKRLASALDLAKDFLEGRLEMPPEEPGGSNAGAARVAEAETPPQSEADRKLGEPTDAAPAGRGPDDHTEAE